MPENITAEVVLSDDERKALVAEALKILKAEQKGETPEDTTLQRKDPTSVSAIDPEDAIDKEKSTTFGAPAVIHDKRTLKDFSIAKAIRGVVFGNWKDAGLEKEWVRNKAALETGDDSSGGFLVPDVVSNEVIDRLRAKSVFRAAGALIIPNAPKTLRIPTLESSSTAYWVGDSALTSAITESEPTFGQLTLTLRRVAARSLIDEDLLRYNVSAAEPIVEKDIIQQIALAEDLKFWNGSGGVEPLGILNWPSANTTAIGGAVDFDDLFNAMNSIDGRNGEYNAWIMHPSVYNAIRQLKTADAAYHFATDLTKGTSKQLLGLPVYTTTQVATSYILLGNFPNYAIAEDGGIEIKVLREKYADQLQVGVVAVHRVDGAPRQLGEFQILTGITV